MRLMQLCSLLFLQKYQLLNWHVLVNIKNVKPDAPNNYYRHLSSVNHVGQTHHLLLTGQGKSKQNSYPSQQQHD